ncbi:MAG: hypothetical protein NTW66_01860 [Candidatus Magasanikbacteria bacterium]|nr:hypothetical protein [Candidatus Magasanikbacteria bacterium]
MKLKICILMLTLIFLTGCTKKNMITVSDGKGGFIQVEDTSGNNEEKAKKGDISTDICQEFTPDFVYSVIHKPIVRVEPSPLATVYACDYFTDYKEDFYKDAKYNFVGPGGPSISIVLDNLNVERQKEARKYLGMTLGTSSKVNMENIVSYREDKSIWSVDLIINPDRFVWANYSHKAITDDELITLAAAMADKIQGRLEIKIEKNPIDLAKEKEKSLGESQEKMVNQFFGYLSGKKISEAIAMMDANDDTKQGWGVNFNTINSLTVKSCAEDMKDDWTADRQRFICELDVSVKPEGEQMGWNQGANTRWIMMTKTNGKWWLHEFANNP